MKRGYCVLAALAARLIFSKPLELWVKVNKGPLVRKGHQTSLWKVVQLDFDLLYPWELAQFQGETIETGSTDDRIDYGVPVKSSYRKAETIREVSHDLQR